MNDIATLVAVSVSQDALFSDSEWAEIFAALRVSPQQRRIVTLMAQGMGDKQIARELGMAYGTLRTHVGRMFAHLGVADRAELVVRVVHTFRRRCGECPCRCPR